MKKLLIVLALISVFAGSIFAQEAAPADTDGKNPASWSSLSYQNVPVIKVLDSREGYLVIYEKYRDGAGSVVIPKDWVRGTVENPRKLKFRDVKSDLEAYMSIVKENGEFKYVVLNLPKSRSSRVWGNVERGTVLEGVDKATLEELDLY